MHAYFVFRQVLTWYYSVHSLIHLDSLDEVVGKEEMIPQADEEGARFGTEDKVSLNPRCDLERYVSHVPEKRVLFLAFVDLPSHGGTQTRISTLRWRRRTAPYLVPTLAGTAGSSHSVAAAR